MKKLFLKPESLFLANTEILVLEGLILQPKERIYPSRKDVAVIHVCNHFFELEKISNNGLWLGKPLPTNSQCKEYINLSTIREFPYESDFDFSNVTLESLREAYHNYQLKNHESMSGFGITGLYIGNIMRSKVLTEQYKNSEKVSSQVFLLQFENGEYITLEDFLKGKNKGMTTYPIVEGQEYVDKRALQEIPLGKIEEIVRKVKENNQQKHLQFPKNGI